MDNFIKLLDKNLNFIRYEIINDNIYVHAISNRNEVACPFCKEILVKVHSHYSKSFQDLPIQGKKTNRLENEIISLSLNMSSITSSKYLKRSIANVQFAIF